MDDASLLKQQRAALEALATTLESVEQDFHSVATGFASGAQISSQFISSLAASKSAVNQKQNLRVSLASSSKWRRALIAQILPEGFEIAQIDAVVPAIDEKQVRREDPTELVLAIANAKADAVQRKLVGENRNKVDLVICCDQVIVFDEEIREKPETVEECKQHLQSYGNMGVPARCLTGMVVFCPHKPEVRVQGTEQALQYFKPIPDRVADVLIAKGDVMSCAGSFVVEDPLLQPYLGKREGDLETVQGMPKQLTRSLLLQAATLVK